MKPPSVDEWKTMAKKAAQLANEDQKNLVAGLPEWNDDFDKLCKDKNVPYTAVVPLFHFISDQLSKTRESTLKEVGKEIDRLKYIPADYRTPDRQHWNSALTTLLSKLDKLNPAKENDHEE